jgi:hypothetical protein
VLFPKVRLYFILSLLDIMAKTLTHSVWLQAPDEPNRPDDTTVYVMRFPDIPASTDPREPRPHYPGRLVYFAGRLEEDEQEILEWRTERVRLAYRRLLRTDVRYKCLPWTAQRENEWSLYVGHVFQNLFDMQGSYRQHLLTGSDTLEPIESIFTLLRVFDPTEIMSGLGEEQEWTNRVPAWMTDVLGQPKPFLRELRAKMAEKQRRFMKSLIETDVKEEFKKGKEQVHV